MVYVISKNNEPLMPCSNVIARLLLKQGKAKVKRKEPFTIKLNYETTNYTQNLTLGVDTGSGTIGTAVSNDKGELEGKTKGNLKYATQMNLIRKQLLKIYSEAIETFGYVTKANRLQLSIEKEHYYDACVIATGGKAFKVKSNLYKKKCVSCGDFEQTKGVQSEQPIITDKICGFRKFDKVKYFGKKYFIKGRMSSGYAVLMNMDGKKIDFSSIPKGFKTPKMVNLKRLAARSSWIVTTVEDIQNIA